MEPSRDVEMMSEVLSSGVLLSFVIGNDCMWFSDPSKFRSGPGVMVEASSSLVVSVAIDGVNSS